MAALGTADPAADGSGAAQEHELRVLYEIIRRDQPITAAEIAKELGLDAGYLSRILRGFEVRGYIVRQTSDRDGRQSLDDPDGVERAVPRAARRLA